MVDVNPETGEALPRTMIGNKSPRFTLWLAFFAFSTITMGSAVSVKRSLEGEVSTNARWGVFCTAFSFVMTGIVTGMHLFPVTAPLIFGTKLEGILTLVLAAFWAATVSVVANAQTGLAVDPDKGMTIVNGNLYYFSWAGFVTSILLVVSYLRGVFGVDVYGEVQNRAARLMVWAGFLACQLVVMGATANILDKDCSSSTYDSNNPVSYCRRTQFGIAVGAIGTLIALLVVAMKMLYPTLVLNFFEGVLSLLLCTLNGFGVAFLTSADGPGSPIGNIYYFSWLSWFTSFMLLASIYEERSTTPNTNTSEDDGGNVDEENGDGDIPLETITDDNEI